MATASLAIEGYEPVIGLEVHAQILTRTKAFCGCATSFGDPPNTHTCPVCLGLPGALPVLNREAVRLAMRAAVALSCRVEPTSIFARKNYFYPDLPKGYQISQFDRPLATRGWLEVEAEPRGKTRIGILRVHMEEDAGKNLHGLGSESIVDLNRAGTPLIEIVGDPDLRSAREASDYLKRLREILMFLGVNDGNLEQGSFRCDANVSVRRVGETRLGTRTELKNINSFRFVEEAIDVEVRRQIAVIEGGQRVRQQTRGYNSEKRESYLLRDKENESGYRYFPEPDLPPLVVDAAALAEIERDLPESPQAKRARYAGELGLTPYAAGVLTGHPRIAAFFERAAALAADPVKVANFVQGEVLRDVRVSGLEAALPISPEQLAGLLRLVDEGAISGKQAKEVYAAMVGTELAPEHIVREKGMLVISDEAELERLAGELLEQNPKQVAGYRSGKPALLGYFVGQMMKQTGGSASPSVVNSVLKRLLDAPATPGAATGTPPTSGVSGTSGAPSTRRVTGGEAPPMTQMAPTVQGPTPAIPRSPVGGAPREAAPAPEHAPKPAAVRSVLAPPSKTLPSERAPGFTPVPDGDAAVPVPRGDPAPPVLTGSESPSETPTSTATLAGDAAEAPQTIPFEAFERVDLRVGKVLAAARIPRKDKLLDLQVDTGDASGPRRIIAGLARSFAPEALVGQSVIVVCNLEARAFSKDLVSHGMILAVGPSEQLALATVTRDVPPGTRVK